MKLIIEEKDLLEGNFDEELIDDVVGVINTMSCSKVEVVYDVHPTIAKVISSGCTN